MAHEIPRARPAIAVQKLCKRYQDVVAVDDLSFEVPAGATYGLLGGNGAGKTTVFKLNNSTAARELIAQLPLAIKVENYSHNEKIFYPPKKLNTNSTPSANAKAGTLAYYAPWGNVVMFFKDFGSASGLYELGQAVSGSDHIQGMSGTIRIEKGNGS